MIPAVKCDRKNGTSYTSSNHQDLHDSSIELVRKG